MNIMKRWTTSIASSFDWVISQVENHEALVNASIRDMQSAGARARVQLGRVRSDGEKMKRRIKELKDLEFLWADRALRTHEQDRDKALHCLNRRKQAQREAAVLENQIKEHTRLEEQLGRDLKVIDERVAELKRKKNSFTARQYRAEAAKATELNEFGLIGEIDEIFERWEMKLGDYELASSPLDSLEEAFVDQEKRQDLELELEALLRKE